MSKMSEAFTELQSACTWNQAGIHFTEWMEHFEYLESVGLLEIHRPIHDATGIAYSQEYWRLEVTALGQNLVNGETK
jgi:hypothetical protein